MIVCLCKGVSSRTILDEARRGNTTLRQVRQGPGIVGVLGDPRPDGVLVELEALGGELDFDVDTP